ncbi:MAG: acetyl-CoA carboxylase biotin carboxylase subunit [Nitrospirae bacterium]|nr:acetyl-CoA carboxylase biotin carboxylase subunit [Nitrospirota bacterium]
MFHKILIANRGEIALRIIRACKELGIKTVAIYSTADETALHARFADERVCVGPADSAQSYRNIPNILSAAEITDAEAIHPGYGFLAENAHFAEACEAAGIVFIGPTPDNIALMGDKAKAKETMTKCGVPIMPGSRGVVATEKDALDVVKEIGFPVIIKAVAGGGGRGMRVVHKEQELVNTFLMARAEAKASFGSDDVYIEKFFNNPKHIEVQVLGDSSGNAIHLGERDCSVQRRHQKLIEEAPSPVVDEKMRKKMGEVALKAVKFVNYVSAGTIEFLVDDQNNYYFMEMNTRIQVEHPITEMVTGVDLIKEQIRIAAGEKIRYSQKDIRIKGHSIECRINAEDSEKFTPSPGLITAYCVPGGPGIRVDSAAYAGYTVPQYYDSVIAKLIAYGEDREEAIDKMCRALDEYVIEGIKTTIPFHKMVLKSREFRAGKYSTNLVEHLFTSKR